MKSSLHRGEITALRWKAIDLDAGQLAVVASTEQTDAGAIREKEAKSGRSRTVALPAMAVEELLRLGVRADDDWHVVTQTDGAPLQPRSLTHVVSALPEGMEGHSARAPAQPRQPFAGLEHSPRDRPGALGALLDRDHHGYLQSPDAEHAGRSRRSG